MTTPEQLDNIISEHHRGNTITSHTAEEKLAADLIQLAGRFDLPPDFDTALTGKFVKPIPSHHFPRVAAAIFLGMVLLTAITPPLRAFAQEIIRQIGTFIIRNEDPRTQTVVPSEQQEGFPLISTFTIEDVSALLDFPVYVPSYSPFSLKPVYYALPNDEPSYVVADYRVLTIFQWRSDANAPRSDFPIGEAPIQDVTVNGVPAVWIEQHWAGSYHFNSLLWDDDGFTFALQSPSLPFDEMLKIAESLAAP